MAESIIVDVRMAPVDLRLYQHKDYSLVFTYPAGVDLTSHTAVFVARAGRGLGATSVIDTTGTVNAGNRTVTVALADTAMTMAARGNYRYELQPISGSAERPGDLTVQGYLSVFAGLTVAS